MSNFSFQIKVNNQNNLNNFTEQKNNTEFLDIVYQYFALSFYTIDIITDIGVGCSQVYYNHFNIAFGTFSLIIIPTIAIQVFSIIWYYRDGTKKLPKTRWLIHLLLMGLIYRNISCLHMGWVVFRKNIPELQSQLKLERNRNTVLHLWDSFSKSVPQIIFQLYVLLKTEEYAWLTSVSICSSLMAVTFSIVSFSRIMCEVIPCKKPITLSSIILQLMWHLNTLGARITALVLLALAVHKWMFSIITLHWLIMTLWIRYSKINLFNKSVTMDELNCVYGTVYCFDFFYLSEEIGAGCISTFYAVMLVENLICILAYILLCKTYWIFATVMWSTQTVLGFFFILVCLNFFHRIACIKWNKNISINTNVNGLTNINDSKKNMEDKNTNEINLNTSNHMNVPATSSNDIDFHSIVENHSFRSEELKVNDINKKKRRAICSTKELENIIQEDTQLVAQKRRGIYASTLLNDEQFNSPINDIVNQSVSHCETYPSDLILNDNLMQLQKRSPVHKVEVETFSEILSTHDYENICAVNIAREPWGLRSWQGYFDIETYFHDDSTVRDRRRDTLTSIATSGSSEFNSRDSPPDVLVLRPVSLYRSTDCDTNLINNGHINLHRTSVDSNIFKAKPYIADQHGTFHPMVPIKEELEETTSDTSRLCQETSLPSVSALVATIDKIRCGSTTNSPQGKVHTDNSCHMQSYKQKYLDQNCPSYEHTDGLNLDKNPPTEFTLSQIWFLSKLRTDSTIQTDSMDEQIDSNRTYCNVRIDALRKQNLNPLNAKLSLLYEPHSKLTQFESNSTECFKTNSSSTNYLSSSCDELIPPDKVNKQRSLSLKEVISPTKKTPFKYKSYK